MASSAASAADVDVSRVCSLSRAARKQALANHTARAVELFDRALAAAEALGQPDCLIVARLRILSLQEHCLLFASQPEDESHANVSLPLFKVLNTLNNRRVTNTLLVGRCRAHEVSWFANLLRA